MKPGGPQSIRWPVLDENSKEQFSKEQPRPLKFGQMLKHEMYKVLILTHKLFPLISGFPKTENVFGTMSSSDKLIDHHTCVYGDGYCT